jgi:hypothetical protein
MKELTTTSRHLFVLTIVLVAVASASVIAKSRWWPQPKNASVAQLTVGPPPSTTVGLQSGERGEAELLRLTTKGFEPAEITRPAGKFLLGVTNRTGLPELSLLLINENLRSVGGKRLGREMSWRRVLDLPPGQYALGEASHPDWVCRITITAR